MTVGRTNPTYRDHLSATEDDWRDVRRALRRRHQDDFDRLFEYARRYADAAGYRNRADPTEALLLSMLLGLEAERRRLAARVAALEQDAAGGDGDGVEEDADR